MTLPEGFNHVNRESCYNSVGLDKVERLLLASLAESPGADHYSTINWIVSIQGDVDLAAGNIAFRSLVQRGMIERDDETELYHLTEIGRNWVGIHITKAPF